MIKFYVFDETSELWSSPFDTKEEAEHELNERSEHLWSTEAQVIEVNERQEACHEKGVGYT